MDVDSFVKRQCVFTGQNTFLEKKRIHYWNIQALEIEVFIVKNKLAPETAPDVFTQRIDNHCKLKNSNNFETFFVRTICNGTRSIYLWPKIWDITPEQYKKLKNLNSSKESIKKIVLLNCPCGVCKTCVNRVGFLDW